MSLPTGFVPYVTSARRWRFLREQSATRDGDTGLAAVYRAIRLATFGTPLPGDLPSRALLLAGDVLALEEARGAGVDELRSYGLTTTQAEALITHIEADEEYTVPTTFQTGPRIGEVYDQDEVTLTASAAFTATGNGTEYELGDRGTLRLALDITAVSGTAPVLHVQIQTRATSSDSWRTIGAFAVASAAATQYREFPGCNRYVREQHTLSGTSPSFTYSLTGNAV